MNDDIKFDIIPDLKDNEVLLVRLKTEHDRYQYMTQIRDAIVRSGINPNKLIIYSYPDGLLTLDVQDRDNLICTLERMIKHLKEFGEN
jgi:hypothetical protein